MTRMATHPHPVWAKYAMQGFDSRESCVVHANENAPDSDYSVKLTNGKFEWYWPKSPEDESSRMATQ